MRDTVDKIIKLGLGVVMTGKEQIEKTVDELVEKGEVTRAESRELVDELLKKGEDTRQQMEEMTRERIHAVLQESQLAVKEDIARLEQRIDVLEQAIKTNS